VRVPPPSSEEELLDRARALAGHTLSTLAIRAGTVAPNDSLHAKGWAGTLLETVLGASAGSLSEPDFQLIGIELKTIPVNQEGIPRESTYVCTVPLTDHTGLTWENSSVWRKLQRVLWIPIQTNPQQPPGEGVIGYPLLWSPDVSEQAMLRTDWEELMEMVSLGEAESINARHGTVLQIRPKAAHSRARRWGIGESGERVRTLPRGFYLRPAFTAVILQRHFVMP
jgi:DNA mismatch repair protein MutH